MIWYLKTSHGYIVMLFYKITKIIFIKNNCSDNRRKNENDVFSYYLGCSVVDLKLQLKPLSYPWERVDCANKESSSFF